MMNDGKRYKEEKEKPLNKNDEELQKKYKDMLNEIINKNEDLKSLNKNKEFEVENKIERTVVKEQKNEELEKDKNIHDSKSIKELTKKNTDLILEKIENEVNIERETEKLDEIKKQIEKLEKESKKDDEIVILSKDKINKIKDDVLFSIENEKTEEKINNEEKDTENMSLSDKINENDDIVKKEIKESDKNNKKEEKNKKNKDKEIKEKKKMPKGLKIIGNIIYYITFLFVIIVLILVAVQRFSDNKISVGGYRMFNVLTASMEPDYKVGDVLVSKEVEAKDIQLGDDITYLGKEKPFTDLIVTHRVVDLNKEADGTYSFITRGIANNVDDPVISESQIFGKVIYKVQIFSLLSKAINNMYVFFFIIFVPVVILVAIKIIQVKHEKIEEDEVEED